MLTEPTWIRLLPVPWNASAATSEVVSKWRMVTALASLREAKAVQEITPAYDSGMPLTRRNAGSQTSLRDANRARLVEAVRHFGGMTQVELSSATGLSPATVSTIVKVLTGAGVLETHTTSRSGRRAVRVTIARQVGLVAGIHVGARTLRVALSDLALDVVAEQQLPLPPDHRLDATLDRAALLALDLVEHVGARLAEIHAVGVAVPGPVDKSGTFAIDGALRGWDGVSLADVIGTRLGVPVYAEKDANLAALAEHTLGVAQGRDDFLYVRAGATTTAAVIVGGQVMRGVAGTAGEIGHVAVDPQGQICRCGLRGCLDTVVGEQALTAAVRNSHGNLSLRDVVSHATKGDVGCRRTLGDAGLAIGAVTGAILAALAPSAVVVGGELVQGSDCLAVGIREAVERCALPRRSGPTPVLVGDLRDRAEILGALALARRNAPVPTSPILASAPEPAVPRGAP